MAEDYDPRKHNYYPKVMRLYEEHGDKLRGKVSDVDIRHDSWCGIYSGGYCNCNPDVELRTVNRK
jgi:hypothetical protein